MGGRAVAGNRYFKDPPVLGEDIALAVHDAEIEAIAFALLVELRANLKELVRAAGGDPRGVEPSVGGHPLIQKALVRWQSFRDLGEPVPCGDEVRLPFELAPGDRLRERDPLDLDAGLGQVCRSSAETGATR